MKQGTSYCSLQVTMRKLPTLSIGILDYFLRGKADDMSNLKRIRTQALTSSWTKETWWFLNHLPYGRILWSLTQLSSYQSIPFRKDISLCLLSTQPSCFGYASRYLISVGSWHVKGSQAGGQVQKLQGRDHASILASAWLKRRGWVPIQILSWRNKIDQCQLPLC